MQLTIFDNPKMTVWDAEKQILADFEKLIALPITERAKSGINIIDNDYLNQFKAYETPFDDKYLYDFAWELITNYCKNEKAHKYKTLLNKQINLPSCFGKPTKFYLTWLNLDKEYFEARKINKNGYQSKTVYTMPFKEIDFLIK